jgi:hypothetical protein
MKIYLTLNLNSLISNIETSIYIGLCVASYLNMTFDIRDMILVTNEKLNALSKNKFITAAEESRSNGECLPKIALLHSYFCKIYLSKIN